MLPSVPAPPPHTHLQHVTLAAKLLSRKFEVYSLEKLNERGLGLEDKGIEKEAENWEINVMLQPPGMLQVIYLPLRQIIQTLVSE